MYRTHTCEELTTEEVGEEVMLSGWVHRRRDLGGLVFVDLRDRYGKTQIVFDPEEVSESVFSEAEELSYEYVIKIEGEVVKRDPENVNDELSTGDIEVQAKDIEILTESKTLPFEIFETDKGEEEQDLRLKHRFLELRRENLKENIIFREQMVDKIHDYMKSRDFLDIKTPLLTVSSPEGARDYLVPSRLHKGNFYALPQAPQQYKQLLMVAGMDRYYQIAPCMRDEDPRADRSPGEFYQLDVETSFMEKEEFFELMEPLFVELTEDLAEKSVMEKPFPRIPYDKAMNKYGSDRPDLRYELRLHDVTEWGDGSEFNIFDQADCIKALTIPDGAEFSRSEIEEFEDKAERNHAKGLAWMKYKDGEFTGPIDKFFDEKQLQTLKEMAKVEDNSIVFFVADEWEIACESLGAVRHMAGNKLGLADEDEIAWAWIVDFPMYEWNRDKEEIQFAHNPFSMPEGGLEALEEEDPLDVTAEQYDIIANGLELSSGAVRNKDPEIMYKAFEIAGHTKEDVDEKFGHMIDAFEYGAPPHCGFAPGIERLVMLLTGEDNIRKVVPFPKNQQAEEPMMGSPSNVPKDRLEELGIEVKEEYQNNDET
jgi:aspartyl-tRNA synthetase